MYIHKGLVEDSDYRELDTPKPLKDFYYIMKLLDRGRELRVIDGDKKGNDILVKLDEKTKLTIISYDTKDDIKGIFQKRWEVFDVSINYLLTYDVYVNDLFYEPDTKVKVNDKVSYLRSDSTERDVAYVKSIYQKLTSDDYIIELTGDDYLYSEDELTKVK